MAPEFTEDMESYNCGLRNIFIWASELGTNGYPCLVGGCYTDGKLQNSILHEWTNEILLRKATGTPVEYALVYVNKPVTKRWEGPKMNCRLEFTQYLEDFLALPEIARHDPSIVFQWDGPKKKLAPLASATTAQEGNYFLCELSRARGRVSAANPDLTELLIKSRTANEARSQGVKKEASHRSPKTRQEVRDRDACCRVTGTKVIVRVRGDNYKGFQSAHIFPLAYWYKAKEIFKSMKMEELFNSLATVKDENGDMRDVKADLPENAFLVRSDVHDQFDDYQCGYWMVNGVLILFRIEKNGAPSVPDDLFGKPLRPAQGNPIRAPKGKGEKATNTKGSKIKEPDPRLFKVHFVTALRWHFAGFGRDPQEKKYTWS
ncbi:hypothetical protein R3P38DRAFT_3221613 [Favolaschia claudopus]|uniref:HNH nuclease domain-containing protein n=1 Tax=Favolaschia claudopus TaxID=2862362 RepID=A0AAW0A0Y3_9AGAR